MTQTEYFQKYINANRFSNYFAIAVALILPFIASYFVFDSIGFIYASILFLLLSVFFILKF